MSNKNDTARKYAWILTIAPIWPIHSDPPDKLSLGCAVFMQDAPSDTAKESCEDLIKHLNPKEIAPYSFVTDNVKHLLSYFWIHPLIISFDAETDWKSTSERYKNAVNYARDDYQCDSEVMEILLDKTLEYNIADYHSIHDLVYRYLKNAVQMYKCKEKERELASEIMQTIK